MTLSPRILVIIISCIALLLVIIIMYVAYKRHEQKKLFAEQAAYVRDYERFWYDYLVNDAPLIREAIPKTKGAFLAVEQLLLSYVDNVSNDTIREKIADFANRRMSNYYKHMLQETKWSRRMNALFRIADFQIDTLLPQCVALYDKSSTTKEERYTLLTIFATWAPETFEQHVLHERSDMPFSEFEYRRIYATLPKERLLGIMDKLDALPNEAAQYALIDTLGSMHDVAYVEPLQHLLASNAVELRIRAMKNLHQLRSVDDLSLYTPFMRSFMWEERLMVAKILQHVPLTYSEELLVTLLEDDNWWVRKQAAETIVQHRGGVDVLKRHMHVTTDRFAQEVAQEVLTKAGVAV